MPLGPMDDFLAHQTPETFDHVYTGDRAFYDRYYFNCHSCSDEIFLITGMGQYPNLGVLDVVPGGLKIIECAEGVAEADLRAATGATILAG